MNKLATALLIPVLALVLIGCSSGSSSSPEPQDVNGQYSGTWTNTPGNQDGTAVFNLSQPEGLNSVTGNAIFESTGDNNCLLNGTVTGTVTGFSLALTVGNTNFQLSIDNNGNTLSGTYVQTQDTDTCSGETGSGQITVTRG